MVTTPSSSGWRSASSAGRGNSGSSSRNSTPRCARLASPGRGPGAAADDRGRRGPVVRRAKRRPRDRAPRPGGSSPATEWIRVTSSASSARAAAGSPAAAARASSCRCPAARRAAGCGRPRRRSRARAARAPGRGRRRDRARRRRRASPFGVDRRRLALAAQVGDGLGEVTHAAPARCRRAPPRRRLGGADEPLEPGAPRALGRGEHAADRPQPAVERQLAEGGVLVERARRHLVRGGEHRERDRQVEAGPFLAQRRRREVDGDRRRGPLELGRGDAAADALLRLLAGAVGEPDDRERRRPLRWRCASTSTRRGSRPTSAWVTVRASTLPRLQRDVSVPALCRFTRAATSTSSKYSPARRPVRRFTCRVAAARAEARPARGSPGRARGGR